MVNILRRLLPISLVLPLAVLAYDVCRLFYPKSANEIVLQHSTPGAISDASLTLGQLRYDKVRQICTADALLEVRSNLDIRSVYFSYFTDADTEKRDWLLFTRSAGGFAKEWEEVPAPNAKPVSLVWIKMNLEIPVRTLRQEVLFPFDAYVFRLGLAGCINDEGNACLGGKNLNYKNLILSSAADADLTIDLDLASDGAINVNLERKLFVRIAIVYFLIVALIYGIFLGVYGDAKDIMAKSIGLFAGLFGLRALVVPKTITILPTLFEYLVLAILILLFALTTYKLSNPKTSREDI